MEWAPAIDHLRRALGKGPDAALSAAARIMEYGPDRTCTYAELQAACSKASSAREPAPAWVQAQSRADAAQRQLARSAKRPPGSHPDSTLECWLEAVDNGYQGRFPWAPLVRWFLDAQPPGINERRATVSTAEGHVALTRRPRLASQACTGRWSALVRTGKVDGVLVAARTPAPRPALRLCRPDPPPKEGGLSHLPQPPRDERLVMLAAFDRRNPVLRGDASLLLDVAHMADRPVRGTVREWAALLARSRDGSFRYPHPSDCRRVWDAALAGRCMHLRERDAAGKLTGRWAPLAHVDADWNASRPADPNRDELILGPSQWLRDSVRSTGGWTLTAAGGERGKNRITVGEQSMAGLLVAALEYYLTAYYDGRAGVSRHMEPDHPGGPGPVVVLPWPSVMYLMGDPWEFASEKQRSAAYARFRRAMERLRGRGYFVPGAVLGSSAPAGDSVEILACSGRPARVWLRASDWFCAAAQQVAARPNGFTQVPLGDYLRRSEWRVPPPQTTGAGHA